MALSKKEGYGAWGWVPEEQMTSFPLSSKTLCGHSEGGFSAILEKQEGESVGSLCPSRASRFPCFVRSKER